MSGNFKQLIMILLLVFIGKNVFLGSYCRFYTTEEIGVRELDKAVKEKKVEAIISL